MSKGNEVSRFLNVSHNQRVTTHVASTGISEISHLETIIGNVDKNLVEQLMNALRNAREIGIQRKENRKRKDNFKDAILSRALTSTIVEVCVHVKDGKNYLYLVDGGHRITAVSECLENGSVNVLITIRINVSKSFDAIRRLSWSFDNTGSSRTVGDHIHTSFGKEVADKRMGHIKLQNAALVNIKAGCPNHDLDRLEVCNPNFDRMKIVSYENFDEVKKDWGTNDWLYRNFPISISRNRDESRVINLAVCTAMILTYKLALEGKLKLSVAEVTEIWKNYQSGTMPPKAGFEEFVRLRSALIKKPNTGGGGNTARYQSSYYQWAVCAFNMAMNHGTGTIERYMPGSRYLVGSGLINPRKIKKTKKALKVV